MNLDELRSLYDFSGRTILITGGTGVLGSEIARTLVECNANVAILNRDAEAAKKTIEHLPGKAKGRALPVSGDVLNAETLHKARH